jgi:AcrR family transcriptional regulator
MQLRPAAERRRLRHREEARRSILDAAERLLVEEGHHRFSMRRLAQRCGYTAPTLYHYFEDKSGLLDALLEERFRRLLEQLRRVPSGGDPLSYARELIVAFIRFGLTHPTHYLLLTLPRDPQKPRPPSAEKAMELMAAPLLQLDPVGRLSDHDLQCARQSMRALIHGLVSLMNAYPEEDWDSELPQHAVDAMLRGLLGAEPALRRERA